MTKTIGKLIVLFALRVLASIQLKKYRAKVVGITGSVGKTSLVEACSLALETKYKLLKLKEGYNSEIGIPLAILGQKTGFSSPIAWAKIILDCLWKIIADWKKYDIALLEMGVDKPNDMKYLTSFIKPYASVFLNVAPVHTENFEPTEDALKDIFEEKSILIKKTKPEGFTVLNADDPMIKTLRPKARVVWFGSLKGPDVCFQNISIDSKGLSFQVGVDDKKYSIFAPNIFGKEYASTFSAAIALGIGFDILSEKSIEALKNFKLPPGRLNVLKGIKNTTLIDGSYNASRLSMIQALKVLKLHKNRKRIAVLGDMRELGDYAEREHQAVAGEAAKAADELVLLGPLMEKYFYPEVVNLGFDEKKIWKFKKAGEILEFLKRHLKGREVVLLKGSQNTIFLEIAVEGLLANKADSHLLCRRGPQWDRLRKAYK